MGGELHFGWVLGGPGNPSHLGRSRARAAGRRPAASAPSRYKAKAIGTMNAACASSQPSMFVVITVGKPAPLKSACSRCTRADLVPSAQGRSPRARPARLASLRLSCTSFEVAGPARPRAVPGEDSPRTHSFERCRPLGAAPTVQVRNGWHGGYERDGAVGVPRDHVGTSWTPGGGPGVTACIWPATPLARPPSQGRSPTRPRCTACWPGSVNSAYPPAVYRIEPP